MLNRFINYLQNRSHQAKSRIISFVVVIGLLAGGAIWINGIKTNFSDLETSDFLRQRGSVLSATKFIVVESYEQRDNKILIHFKVTNPTSDILNFPSNEKITLNIDGENIIPEKVVDRQNQAFVKKILSNNTVYGTMVFGELKDTEGTLTIDELFFEQANQNVFKETVDLNLESLNPVEELRS